MTGCVAINPASIAEPREQDAIGNAAALSYSNSIFNTSPTWNEVAKIIFTNYSMIDGQGYEWNTGAKAGTASAMPHPAGGALATGNTGNGYARITFLP
jgi:hypothetical protein